MRHAVIFLTAADPNSIEYQIELITDNVESKSLELFNKDIPSFAVSKMFVNLKNLRSLILIRIERCNITAFDPEELPQTLKILNLRENKIRKFDFVLNDCVEVSNVTYKMEEIKLKQLYLQSNLFTDFPYAALQKQDELELIDISRNRIKSINLQDDFSKFTKLKLLDLSANQLTKFPIAVMNCKSLLVLRLIQNNIEHIPEELVKNNSSYENSSLSELNLNHNPLKEITKEFCNHFYNLKFLGISKTDVVKLPENIAKDMQQLEVLQC